MNEGDNKTKLDCQQLKQWLNHLCLQDQTSNHYKIKSKIQNLLEMGKLALNEYNNNTIERRTGLNDYDKIILDLRTYICAKGKCLYHNNRKHRRITNYNHNKMLSLYMKINIKLENITNEIIYIWTQEISNNKTHIKITHFIKETSNLSDQRKKVPNTERYKPIENLFTKIDEMAEKNNIKARNRESTAAPGQKITQKNNLRMTYGDINYLGDNKAIFYFNRGIRGKQSFTNSMYSIKQQPPHKDIVIIS